MKQIIICLAGILCLSKACCQNNFTTNRLHIGDPVPSFKLGSFQNHPAKNFFINDFKGKIVILDFWNIWCTACLKAMPEMDALQRKFKDQLQIVLVTNNSAQQVDKLFSKIKMSKPALPMITDDSLLHAFFPHVGDPFHVWINQKGTVQYTTAGYNATERNIQALLDGRPRALGLRSQLADSGQSLLMDGANALSNYVCYNSLLIKGYHEFSNQSNVTQKKHDTSLVTVSLRNVTILQLYTHLFSKKLYGMELARNNRIIVEQNNTDDLIMPAKSVNIDDWKNDHLFSYELKLPANKESQVYDLMLEDLNRYFSYAGKIEKRKVWCWALTRNSKFHHSNVTSDPPQIDYSGSGDFCMTHMPILEFIRRFVLTNQYNECLPIVDETGICEPVTLDLKCGLNDIPALQRELSHCGLELSKVQREIEVLVIRTKDRSSDKKQL